MSIRPIHDRIAAECLADEDRASGGLMIAGAAPR
jgi:co-chaperonin GroES (HSP10)